MNTFIIIYFIDRSRADGDVDVLMLCLCHLQRLQYYRLGKDDCVVMTWPRLCVSCLLGKSIEEMKLSTCVGGRCMCFGGGRVTHEVAPTRVYYECGYNEIALTHVCVGYNEVERAHVYYCERSVCSPCVRRFA